MRIRVSRSAHHEREEEEEEEEEEERKERRRRRSAIQNENPPTRVGKKNSRLPSPKTLPQTLQSSQIGGRSKAVHLSEGF